MIVWKLFEDKYSPHSIVEFVTNSMLSTLEKATKCVGAVIKAIKTEEDNL